MSVGYRVYADDTIVHEDDFHELDNELPYRDDYATFTVPEGIKDLTKRGIPSILVNHIKECYNET